MAKAALCYAYGNQRRDAVVRSSSCHGRPSLAGIFSSLSLYFLYLNGVYRGRRRAQDHNETQIRGLTGQQAEEVIVVEPHTRLVPMLCLQLLPRALTTTLTLLLTGG